MQLTRVVTRWRDDPVAFAREALGVDLWSIRDKSCGRSGQAEVARDLARSRRVAWAASQKVGKSRLDATIALWWVLTRRQGRVIFLASRAQQVQDVLWSELRRLHTQSRFPVGGQLNRQPHTGFHLDSERFVLGFSADSEHSERLGGYSGAEILFIVDEASGFSERLWPAVLGNLAGGGKVLATGNPLRTSGTFFDAFHDKRDIWSTHNTASWDTPNAVAGEMVVPGLATREWIEEMRADYGESSPVWAARVAGEFPRDDSDTVVPLHLVEAAIARWPTTPVDPNGGIRIGVDVARYGDDESVIQPVIGDRAFECVSRRGADGPQLAGAVNEWLDKHQHGRPVVVNIDCTGGFGDSLYDQLRQQKRDGVRLVRVNAASKATNRADYRLRDQLWFGIRNWIEDGGAIPNDRKLVAELVAPGYSLAPNGRRRVDSKEQIKAGGLKRSPDRADALALAVLQTRPVDTRAAGYRSPRGWSR